jgi:hypothetical protein
MKSRFILYRRQRGGMFYIEDTHTRKQESLGTNILLRELHNFCISMNWLAWPIIPRRLWPKIEYGPKRAITADEHRMIVEMERNLERGRFMSFAGTWAVHKPTSPIWRLKTSTGPTALLLMPAEKPELRHLSISVRRLKQSYDHFRARDFCYRRLP